MPRDVPLAKPSADSFTLWTDELSEVHGAAALAVAIKISLAIGRCSCYSAYITARSPAVIGD
jgi:hypothetical protein